ncbi:flagellar hook-associated protein FlgL [Peribacillus saganii]|uniref:Flagellar hook-associated protein FlgL n=1 Tax=Peribacillus saganii TaxID=2303992 RepID=A0A372LP87_9BACI|nr:flagellar hook-associated protein FlgL [Peribacillus saganii]RFU68300.1 flagellar hook-associated protein FlgL [Peribacillus saganii]
MRVTQSMLSNNMLRNLSNSFERIGKLQEQISSQKKITRPSDDPVVAMQGILYRRNLEEVEQFKRNYSEAYNWVENSDTSLDKAGHAIDRIRELMVQVTNDMYDISQRQSTMEEIDQLKNHLVDIANTKSGDKYLFNGTDTLNAPVIDGNPPSFATPRNNNSVELELAKGVYIPVNAKSGEAFSDDLFTDIQKVISDLQNGKPGKELSQHLDILDKHKSNLVNARADLGARANRIELMADRIDNQHIMSEKMLSENEDIDIEKVITEFTTQESVHRAALSIGSKIIQPTLMDFLR